MSPVSIDSSLGQTTGSLGHRGREVSGWRRYDLSDLARLQVIRAARDMGFNLDQTQALLRTYIGDTRPPIRGAAWRPKSSPTLTIRNSFGAPRGSDYCWKIARTAPVKLLTSAWRPATCRSSHAPKASLTARRPVLEPARAALPACLQSPEAQHGSFPATRARIRRSARATGCQEQGCSRRLNGGHPPPLRSESRTQSRYLRPHLSTRRGPGSKKIVSSRASPMSLIP